MPAALLAGEQPGSGSISLDILPENRQRDVREERVSVLALFSLTDVDKFSFGIDVFDPESDDFSDSEPG